MLISSCTHSSNTSRVGSGNACRCKYLSWNGKHLIWRKCNIRNASLPYHSSPQAPSHLATSLSGPDNISALTLPPASLVFQAAALHQRKAQRQAGPRAGRFERCQHSVSTPALVVCRCTARRGKEWKVWCYQVYKRCFVLSCDCWLLPKQTFHQL